MYTKILITVGPSVREKSVLKALVERGVRLFRLNFSHGDADSFKPTVSLLRTIQQETGSPLTLLQDLSGPKYRIGDLQGDSLEIIKGEEYLLGKPGPGTKNGFIPFSSTEILEELASGDTVVLSDGSISFEVQSRETPGVVRIRARNSGLVASRKGIAFPGKSSERSVLTDKDRKDIQEGAALGMDAVALSFVRNAEDIHSLRELLRAAGNPVPVVAKLERKAAVQNFPSILDYCDAVMLARGDLGVECPLHELPELQKRILRACNAKGKPVIVATQMLLSMVDNPRPTRAETTDVANAVLDGADCVMLSEETAIGKYPLATVEFMQRITRHAESFFFEQVQTPRPPDDQDDPVRFLAYGACLIAEKSRASGLVAHTMSGQTALLLSACRPRQAIAALSPSSSVASFLNFSWGVTPHVIGEAMQDHLARAEHFINTNADFSPGCTAVITAGHTVPGQHHAPTNMVKLFQKPT